VITLYLTFANILTWTLRPPLHRSRNSAKIETWSYANCPAAWPEAQAH
jgi:hypothetical protein